MKWVKHNAALLAFVFLAASGFYALEQASHNDAEDLRDAQVAACVRVNALRVQVNEQGESLKSFLIAGAETRRMLAGEGTDKKINLKAAREYERLASGISRISIVDCEKVFPKP